jgi:hypothetical protein
MRAFRSFYWCDHCPHEFCDEAMVVAAGFCPCCDAATEPYDSQEFIEEEAYD